MTISSWFFVFAVWCAAFTALALWTPRLPGVLVPMGFFATWLTSELAVWHLLWQLVAVVVFVAFGALDSWPGWVGLAVMALSWIGLLAALVAASHTDDAFENAFAETLGSSWRDTIDPVMSSHPSGIKWTRMFSALRFKRRGAVVRTRDVQYVDDGLRRHRLDVWRRDGVGPAAPVLLQIHGGGWMIGSKEQQARPLMRHLADRGLGLRCDQLRALPEGDMAPTPRRLQARFEMGARAHRRIRRRSRIRRRHGRLRRRTPRRDGWPHRQSRRISARF